MAQGGAEGGGEEARTTAATAVTDGAEREVTRVEGGRVVFDPLRSLDCGGGGGLSGRSSDGRSSDFVEEENEVGSIRKFRCRFGASSDRKRETATALVSAAEASSRLVGGLALLVECERFGRVVGGGGVGVGVGLSSLSVRARWR